MEQRFLKFQESKQAAVKLAIAAEDCFQTEIPPEYQKVYKAYLLQRQLPAAQFYAAGEDLEGLEALWNLNPFSPAMLEELLKFSVKEHKKCACIYLLRKKREIYGFTPRDFSL